MDLTRNSPIKYDFVPIPGSKIILEFKLKSSKNKIKVNVDTNIFYKDPFIIGRVFLVNSGLQYVYTYTEDKNHSMEFNIPEFKNRTQSYINISIEPIGNIYEKVYIEDIKISEVTDTAYAHPNTSMAVPNLGPKIGGNLNDIKDIVTKGYTEILKREPDPLGLENYINQLKSGLSIENFHNILRSSDEYKQRFSEHDIISEQETKRDLERFKEGQKVVIASVVRNEEENGNLGRFLDCCSELEHYHNIVYIFIEGDSSDRTYEILKNWVGQRNGSILEKIDRGHAPFGKTKDTRRTAHLATLRNRLIELILSIPEAGEALIIDANYGWKGDLISSLRDANASITAPLVVMQKDSSGRYIFYDIWVFRKNGKEFWPIYPYAEGMQFDNPVDVDSVGGGYLVKRQVLDAGVRYNGDNDSEQVGFCRHARTLGFDIKINPRVHIIKGGSKE